MSAERRFVPPKGQRAQSHRAPSWARCGFGQNGGSANHSRGMITATSYHADARYRPAPGSGYDGVVRVQSSGLYATAALLFDGRAVLTAAHLFDGRSGAAPTQVTFETRLGTQTLTSTQILVHPRHDTDANNDLALVWLSGLVLAR